MELHHNHPQQILSKPSQGLGGTVLVPHLQESTPSLRNPGKHNQLKFQINISLFRFFPLFVFALMMEPMLLKPHEVEHLPMSWAPQAVCTGCYSVPVRIIKLLNIKERFTRFFWTIKGHTCFLGSCRREVGYVHKISETLSRFVFTQKWFPFLS